MDLCAVSGFSLGAKKSRNRLARSELDILGDIVGREHIKATNMHLKTITEWGEINDTNAMRRFLGNFQWVRKVMPLETVIAPPLLTQQPARMLRGP